MRNYNRTQWFPPLTKWDQETPSTAGTEIYSMDTENGYIYLNKLHKTFINNYGLQTYAIVFVRYEKLEDGDIDFDYNEYFCSNLYKAEKLYDILKVKI